MLSLLQGGDPNAGEHKARVSNRKSFSNQGEVDKNPKTNRRAKIQNKAATRKKQGTKTELELGTRTRARQEQQKPREQKQNRVAKIQVNGLGTGLTA